MLPTRQDFKQFAYNLIRLEEVYQVDFTRSTTERATELGLEDILALGKVAFDNLNFKQFNSWCGNINFGSVRLFGYHYLKVQKSD